MCGYRNVFGSYLHCSLLPKNPSSPITDRAVSVEDRVALDYAVENAAHTEAVDVRRSRIMRVEDDNVKQDN